MKKKVRNKQLSLTLAHIRAVCLLIALTSSLDTSTMVEAAVPKDNATPSITTRLTTSAKDALTAAQQALSSTAQAAYHTPGKIVGVIAEQNLSAQPVPFITGDTNSLASVTGYKKGWTFTGVGQSLYDAPGNAVSYITGKTDGPTKLLPSFLTTKPKSASGINMTTGSTHTNVTINSSSEEENYEEKLPPASTITGSSQPVRSTEVTEAIKKSFEDNAAKHSQTDAQTPPKSQLQPQASPSTVPVDTFAQPLPNITPQTAAGFAPVRRNKSPQRATKGTINIPVAQIEAQPGLPAETFTFDTSTSTIPKYDNPNPKINYHIAEYTLDYENPKLTPIDAEFSFPDKSTAVKAAIVDALSTTKIKLSDLTQEQQAQITELATTALQAQNKPLYTIYYELNSALKTTVIQQTQAETLGNMTP